MQHADLDGLGLREQVGGANSRGGEHRGQSDALNMERRFIEFLPR